MNLNNFFITNHFANFSSSARSSVNIVLRLSERRIFSGDVFSTWRKYCKS